MAMLFIHDQRDVDDGLFDEKTLKSELESLFELALKSAAPVLANQPDLDYKDQPDGDFVDCCIDLSLVDDEQIQGVNKEQRGIDSPTDVLSFPMLFMREGRFIEQPSAADLLEIEDRSVLFLGDILISVETAKRQALSQDQSLKSELLFLALHGILHLLGYDHEIETDEMTMRALQRAILADL